MIDCDSANGTWIKDQAFKSTQVHEDTTFRVATVPLTPAKLLGLETTTTSRTANELKLDTLIKLVSVPAVVGLVGLVLILSGVFNRPKQKENANNTSPVLPTVVNSSASDSPEQTETDPGNTNSARPAGMELVQQAMFLITANIEGQSAAVAAGWLAQPDLLITNSYVVQSMSDDPNQFSLAHCDTGTVCEILDVGCNDQYETCLNKFQELLQEAGKFAAELKAKGAEPDSKVMQSGQKVWKTKKSRSPRRFDEPTRTT